MMSHTSHILDTVWEDAQTRLSAIRSQLNSNIPPAPRIIRVGQLDSELLDQELTHLLQEPLNRAISLINPSLKSRFESEIRLLIQLTLYKFSVWDSGASYGAKLQDLRYIVPSKISGPLAPSGLPRKTLFFHATMTLLIPYIHNRLRARALSHAWPDAPTSDRRRKAWNLMNSLESAHTLAGLLNFIVFMWDGSHRTIADRILKMSLVPARRLVKRDVSYEFMNRQMVWHAFTEFLLFLLPLINGRSIRRRIYQVLSRFSPSLLLSSFLKRNGKMFGISQSSAQQIQQKKGKYWTLPDSQCAICAENASFNANITESSNMFTSLVARSTDSELEESPYAICNPYVTPCGHKYCYHCIAERLIRTAEEAGEESMWECLRCGESVGGATRYIIDTSESNASGSDYDFSSDLDVDITNMSGSLGSYSESFSE